MKLKKASPVWQAIGIGVVAGMRSILAPAVVSHILSRNKSRRLAKSQLSFIQSGKCAVALKVLAASELVADKLPFAPARIEFGGVVARGLSGALSAGVLTKANGKNALMGAGWGIVAATASAYAFYYLRKMITNRLEIYDPITGAVEDLAAIAGSFYLSESYQM